MKVLCKPLDKGEIVMRGFAIVLAFLTIIMLIVQINMKL